MSELADYVRSFFADSLIDGEPEWSLQKKLFFLDDALHDTQSRERWSIIAYYRSRGSSAPIADIVAAIGAAHDEIAANN